MSKKSKKEKQENNKERITGPWPTNVTTGACNLGYDHSQDTMTPYEKKNIELQERILTQLINVGNILEQSR